MLRITLIFIFSILVSLSLSAQEAIVPVGGNMGNGQVSYTVGQIDYSSKSGSNGSMNEGVQQPYEFYIVGQSEYRSISMEMSVFPNPTQSELFLSIKEISLNNLKFKLISSEGKLILDETIHSNKTSIDIQNEASGTYLLSVYTDDKILQTFRLIKNR